MAPLRGAEIDTGAKDSEVLQHPLFAWMTRLVADWPRHLSEWLV